ncbi:EAL domain-containing protein [Citrobacter freundii]|uniref:EAL domain-containing protein n=1 Tax=Citrobacter freundii TaxID=546 RepID=UPI0024DEE3B2|nr:EAL domain-containing protein [Citrobacter freundii]MDK2359198.1 EAL domain-containing protein [Citrobacter freundii]
MNNIISNTGAQPHPDIEHYRLEPFIDLSANSIIGYEVLSQLREGLNPEQWFSRLSGRQQIMVLRQQIQRVSANVTETCFYNLSVAGFLSLNHCDIQAIAEYSHVCLEVADASALKCLNEKERYFFFKNIDRMRISGVKVWIDDFSVDDLITLPAYEYHIDGIKIDKKEIHTRHLKDIIRLIKKALGIIPVLIEGVESERELHKGIASGADIAQGYYWRHKTVIAV